MPRYYWAGGERIPIELDPDLVAVDRKAAAAAGASAELSEVSGRTLPGGVVIAPRARIEAAQLEQLDEAGAVHPVYRHDRACLVPLPEIRVEVDNEAQQQAVLDALADAPHEVVVERRSEGRLVLAPASRRSDDALDIANYVYEHARPAASSVRFVQFVPSPGTDKV